MCAHESETPTLEIRPELRSDTMEWFGSAFADTCGLLVHIMIDAGLKIEGRTY